MKVFKKNTTVRYVGLSSREYWKCIRCEWLLDKTLVVVGQGLWPSIRVAAADNKNISIELSADLFEEVRRNK